MGTLISPYRTRDLCPDDLCFFTQMVMKGGAHHPPKPDAELADLDLGEREAIQLAEEQHADLLLIDERKGRQRARQRGLKTTGTLGVLLSAGELGLIDSEVVYRPGRSRWRRRIGTGRRICCWIVFGVNSGWGKPKRRAG